MKRIVAAFALACLALPSLAQRRARLDYEPTDPALATANLFKGKPTTASGQWSDRGPWFATDGDSSDPGAHWASENNPVWLSVDLGGVRPINAVKVWLYWGDGRSYQYKVEGSGDGQSWQLLADRSQNTKPATPVGELLTFDSTPVRYVKTTILHSSKGDASGGHIVEIEGYRRDPEKLAAQVAWERVGAGLQGSVASLDARYPKDEVPTVVPNRSWKATAWRGERVSGQFLLWSGETLNGLRLKVEGIPGASAHFVRYVRADQLLVADILDDATELELTGRTTRPVWLSVDVPTTCKPGAYKGKLTATVAGGKSVAFDLTLDVQKRTLPAPKDWSFYLDLWQNPYAIARYHHVTLWSPEHFALLRPHLELLANAGQKVLTTTLIHAPWGGQTFDAYDSMIEWTRKADGTFTYDYTNFDRYVAFGRSCGIGPWIHGYSMIPWTNQIRYRDEKTGEYGYIALEPDKPSYEQAWGPFLKDFVAHLRQKGWLKHFRVAMDERPLPLMRAAYGVLKKYAPQVPLALAGDANPIFASFVDDWCMMIGDHDKKLLAERARQGRPTTFYICCSPARPNTFVFSPPAESVWLGQFAAGQGYSGFLRWAYDSWTEDPLFDTKHVTWDAGDCFLVYPGARSSIRFERLREGIQDFEKIRILRKTKASTPALEAALSQLTYQKALEGQPAAPLVNRVKAELLKASQ